MRGNYKKPEIAKNSLQARTLHYLKRNPTSYFYKKCKFLKRNTNFRSFGIFFFNTLYNSTIEFPKLLHQPSLEIKRENSKGENFMKSIILDYFFHYTIAWNHPK
jgi:hypothetical protein